MEVRPGFKQTEVGVVPEEWRVPTLGDVCMFENGDRGINYPSPGSFVLSGIPFINAGHVAEGNISLDEMNYITPASYSHLGSGKIRAGDILFCLRGSLGKFGIVGADFGEGAIASSLVIVRPKAPSVTREYLGCYFGSKLCARMIETWSGGAAQPNLGAQDLARFLLPLPPTAAEQQAITEALKDADALLGELDRLIRKKRHVKQGAMQELLTGKKRLPGFEVRPGYKQTEVGPIPEDWNVERLAAICSMKSGEGITSTNIDQFSKYPCYGGNGLRGFTTHFTHDGRYALIGRQGALCGNVLGVDGKFFASEHAIVVTASARTDIRWLTLALGEMRLNRYSESSAQPGLSVAKLLSLVVAHPSNKSEQEAIATNLSDMDAEITAVEAKLAKACDLKQGMMQELLTGRVRLV